MSDNTNSELRLAPKYIPAAPSTTTDAGITATGAASTAALQILKDAGGYGAPSYVPGVYDFYADGAAACVIFGDASVAAATVNCMVIPIGIPQRYTVTGDRAFLRVIALSGAGTLRWVPVNR